VLRRIAVALGVLVVLGAVLWTVAAHQPRVPVTTAEVAEPREADTIMRLVRKAVAASAERAATDHLHKRDAHAQPHGCVTATLTVDDAIRPDLRQGIFAEPGRRWRAWVRFSNGTGTDDTKPDARGMAIKVMRVRGQKLLDPRVDPERKTQDFVMIDYPTFFVRNLEEYERFFAYQNDERPVAYFFAGPPWRWPLHEFYHAAHMLFQRVPSPLAASYYTMSAYKFGPHNAKVAARPCAPPSTAMPKPRGPHYLREALVRELGEGDACFVLAVQLQDPTKNMPIEDPTIAWDELESPYVPVARLVIPRQTFSTDVQNRFCEQLQFTPWHGLPAHRPLGALNRARKAVYQAVSQHRHFHNEAVRGEPTGWCLDCLHVKPSEARKRAPTAG
jgi:hypothetical protein